MANPGRPKSVEEAIDKLATLKRAELEHCRTDHRLGSELGRLYKSGKIESVHFLAGEAISALAERYKRLKGIPLGRPKPNQFQPRSPGTDNEDYDAQHVREIEATFNEAFGSMPYGSPVIVYDTCVNDEYCPMWELGHLIAGLVAASPHLKLK